MDERRVQIKILIDSDKTRSIFDTDEKKSFF